MNTALTLTSGQALGLYLLGMALGLVAGGVVLIAWLTHRIDAATRLPDRLRRHPDDEPPTERVTNQPADLPRRGSLIDRSL